MEFIKRNYIYLTILIITTLLLRFYNLNFEDLWFDELASLWISDPSISLSDTINRNIEINQGPHLVFTLTLKYFFLLFGYDPYIGKIVPAIFGILSVPTIIYLTRMIDKNKSWLLVGFLISINFYSISYSQELRSYSLVFFLCLMNLIFFLKVLEKNNFLYNLLFFLITLIAACNHIFIFIILFSQSIFLLLFYRNKKNIFFILIINIFIIFLSYLLIMHDSLVAQLAIKEFWIQQVKLDFFANYYFSRFFGSKIMGLIYLVSLVYLLFNQKKILLKHSNKLCLFLLILINSYFLPICYGFIGMPILTDRYIIFVLIPILILISVLIFKLKNKKTRNTILIILVLSSLTNNYIEIFERKNTKPEFKKSISFIEKSNSSNLVLADSIDLNNKLISNYIKLINFENNQLNFYNNVDNFSQKNIWVMCYMPITEFTCNKPSKLSVNFIKKEEKIFDLLKIVFYENVTFIN